MRSKRLGGVAALAVAACAILLGGRPADAWVYHPCAPVISMYYPWAGEFPWDRPGMVNPDVINGWLISTSTHWPGRSNYGHYRPMFGGRGWCRVSARW